MKADRQIRPRGLRREEAASYVGLSPTKFDQLVKRGDMPAGFTVDGCRIWDVQDLDVYFTLLKGEAPEVRQWARM
jgi:predicted DNA-binding transcriptional regulator AlpA